jgi:hypothetical protein
MSSPFALSYASRLAADETARSMRIVRKQTCCPSAVWAASSCWRLEGVEERRREGWRGGVRHQRRTADSGPQPARAQGPARLDRSARRTGASSRRLPLARRTAGSIRSVRRRRLGRGQHLNGGARVAESPHFRARPRPPREAHLRASGCRAHGASDQLHQVLCRRGSAAARPFGTRTSRRRSSFARPRTQVELFDGESGALEGHPPVIAMPAATKSVPSSSAYAPV